MSISPKITRRVALAGLAGTAITLATPALLRAAPAARLALYGPPAGPTITLAHAVATGALGEIAQDVSLTIWRNPDELRAGLTSGTIDLSVVPAQAAAALYNRGMGIRLVNVMTNGLLYVVAAEGILNGFSDLADKRLAVPFPNDTPDFIVRALLTKHGITESVELTPAGSPMEAAQLLMTGRIDAAVLSEPIATVIGIRGREAGSTFVRAINLQDEWGQATGLGPVVPQAGLAVTRSFSEAHGDLIKPLQSLLAIATTSIIETPAEAAEHAAGVLEQPAQVLAQSIPHCNLTATPATEARPTLEAMFSLMAESNPAIIGGSMPDDGFYAL